MAAGGEDGGGGGGHRAGRGSWREDEAAEREAGRQPSPEVVQPSRGSRSHR